MPVLLEFARSREHWGGPTGAGVCAPAIMPAFQTPENAECTLLSPQDRVSRATCTHSARRRAIIFDVFGINDSRVRSSQFSLPMESGSMEAFLIH